VDIPSALDRTFERRLVAGAAIAAGDVVAFDVSASDSARVLTVVQAGVAANGNALATGVALEAASASGDEIRVAVKGYVENVSCTAGVAQGDALVVRVAGEVDTMVATDTASAFGVALEAEVGGTVDLVLY